ncbi:MAG: hypothetical protein ACLQBJ_01780 [Bryobacteraceae bacterium]
MSSPWGWPEIWDGISVVRREDGVEAWIHVFAPPHREHPLLRRSLAFEEARYVTDVARRIAAILLMGPALDANYRAVKENTIEWRSVTKR